MTLSENGRLAIIATIILIAVAFLAFLLEQAIATGIPDLCWMPGILIVVGMILGAWARDHYRSAKRHE